MSTESNINKLSEELSKLTILEVSELVTVLKEKWNVSDAPMMAMAPSAAGSAAPKEAEEQTSFSVVLASHGGEKKMDVIRIVREMTGLGLKEAKDLVDGAPKSIKEDVNKKDAEEMKAKLEALGAKVELK